MSKSYRPLWAMLPGYEHDDDRLVWQVTAHVPRPRRFMAMRVAERTVERGIPTTRYAMRAFRRPCKARKWSRK